MAGASMPSHQTRILVTGGEGILGTALRDYFPFADYRGHYDCDVTSAVKLRQVFHDVRPELVIHCAAMTSHNAEPQAYAVNNIQGTINVVGNARRGGARVVYLSTDYLNASRETSPVAPVNQYAASKFAGELVAAGLRDHLVIRGSWYDRLQLTHAATDAFTSKLPVARAAYYVAALAVSSLTGVINIGNGRRSLYEIALEFNEQVVPVERKQIKLAYELPADCSLDTTRLTQFLNA